LFTLFAYVPNGANSSGRTVNGEGLRPLAFWHCGFESHRRHGCLSVVSAVCCQVEISATGHFLPRDSTQITLYKYQNLTFRYIFVICSSNRSQTDAWFLSFILVNNSTCFGLTYCPSSGVLILYS